MNIADIEALLQVSFFDYQLEAFEAIETMADPLRLCLFYKTGAGKSITSLSAIRLLGHTEVLVVAPPSTHKDWANLGTKMGVVVEAMSHAKFRQKDTRLSRSKPVIADEFHLFGRNTGLGWKKLDGLARGLNAPMILCSATPNYNDAERCYCVQKILDPHSVKGGFIEFIYRNCTTEQNPFGMTPIVTGFKEHESATEYLADLPGVMFVRDDAQYAIVEVPMQVPEDRELQVFGLSRRRGRIVSSLMEKRWASLYYSMLMPDDSLRIQVVAEIETLLRSANGKVLLFADSSTIAEATFRSLTTRGIRSELVTGKTSKQEKDRIIHEFRAGACDVLVGTSTLATGTDGLDKVCHTLVIVHDTDDASLRRQLIGRILPRGDANTAHPKHIYRLVLP